MLLTNKPFTVRSILFTSTAMRFHISVVVFNHQKHKRIVEHHNTLAVQEMGAPVLEKMYSPILKEGKSYKSLKIN